MWRPARAYSTNRGPLPVPLKRLTCADSFKQIAVELVVFSAGAEEFPKQFVVGESALAIILDE